MPQVHKTASPESFWGLAVLISQLNQQLKVPLQLISNSQSRPYSRWFPAGPAP